MCNMIWVRLCPMASEIDASRSHGGFSTVFQPVRLPALTLSQAPTPASTVLSFRQRPLSQLLGWHINALFLTEGKINGKEEQRRW
jgi:hypothetical protein